MKINEKAAAGTMESSDIYIEVAPGSGGIDIQIDSVVSDRFETSIRNTITEVLSEFGVKDAKIMVNDRGALDCTIRARMETALKRASNGGI